MELEELEDDISDMDLHDQIEELEILEGLDEIDLELERDNETLERDEYSLALDEMYRTLLPKLSLSNINALAAMTTEERHIFEKLDMDLQLRNIDKFTELEFTMPVSIFNARELDRSDVLKLNETQKEIDMFALTKEERKRAFQIREVAHDLREIYSNYYHEYVVGKIRHFILETEIPEILHYEARLKTEASVYRSVTCKDEYDDPRTLNDCIGLRFVVNDERDAYKLAKLFYDREIEEKQSFELSKSKDYFVAPKKDADGNIEYEALHLILEHDEMKIEIQIHTKRTYKRTELTHRFYEDRKRVPRQNIEIDFEGIDKIIKNA